MAKKLFLCNLDLNGNQIKNAAIEALSSVPESNLVDGRLYFNTVTKSLEVYSVSDAKWESLIKLSDVATQVVPGSTAPISSGAVANAIAGITGAMHFIAVLNAGAESFEAALAEYTTANPTYVPASGDIMIWKIKEYIFNGSSWQEVGDESVVVTSFGGATGAILVKGGQTDSGSINLTVEGNELKATLVMPTGNQIILSGYAKASEELAITSEDSASTAIGKLEYKIDVLKNAVIENEETIAASLNDLNKRINDVAESVPGKYVEVITADNQAHSVTILASTHKCGEDALASVFYAGSQVVIDQSVNAAGDITISWSESTTVDASNPIKVVIMG
jgi:hypothetical protein